MILDSIPFISEITLNDIIYRIKREYLISLQNIGEYIFGSYKTLQRTKKGARTMNDYDYSMLFKFLKEKSGDTSESFISLLVSWYPALEPYIDDNDEDSENQIKTIIKANLDGTAIQEKQSIKINNTDNNTGSFLKSCIEESSSIICVKFSAQTGWEWIKDIDLLNTIIHLAKSNVEIQIIVNSEHISTNLEVCESKEYNEFQDNVTNDVLAIWNKYNLEYDKIYFRISDYPILRKTVFVNFEGGKSKAIISNYAYSDDSSTSFPYIPISNSSIFFEYYLKEYEYLWNRAITYEKWYERSNIIGEVMHPKEYVLLYASHSNKSTISEADISEWIVSLLTIKLNNFVTLHVNVAKTPYLIDSEIKCEYYYQGNLRLTRNNIYMSLFDETQQEEIHISFVRPLHFDNRMIGIITALSPSGTPAAFKCACFERSILPSINFNLLKLLLDNTNKDWDNSIIIFEMNDINLFYSEKFFHN